MNRKSNTKKLIGLAAAFIGLTLLSQPDASAQRRFGFRGANGGAVAGGTRFQNGGGAAGFGGRFRNSAAGGYAMNSQYGSAAGGAVATPYGGGAFHNTNLAGPNGGSLQGSGGSVYKTGVGAEGQRSFNATGPNGATGNGNSNFKYNAQTGQGTQNAAGQFTSSSGKNYGGSESTNFTKGQGGTTDVTTDNHGSYDVNWAKGTKPVVTSGSTAQ